MVIERIYCYEVNLVERIYQHPWPSSCLEMYNKEIDIIKNKTEDSIFVYSLAEWICAILFHLFFLYFRIVHHGVWKKKTKKKETTNTQKKMQFMLKYIIKIQWQTHLAHSLICSG